MKTAFVLFSLLTPQVIFSQSRLRQPEKGVSPVESFTFLVEGEKFTTAKTIHIENYDILILIDIANIKWRELLSSFNLTLTAFRSLPFFQDEGIRKEYEGLCLTGVTSFNKFNDYMFEIFKYKNENKPDKVVSSCTETPLQIRETDLKRELNNLNNAFNIINETWSVGEIQTNDVPKLILYDFCNTLNLFSIHYENLASSILESLEEFTDGVFPNLLLGNLVRTCANSVNGEGEHYHVTRCVSNNKGMRCQVELSQSSDLKDYVKYYPVHYNHFYLKGEKEKELWVRSMDVKELLNLECTDEYLDFPVCEERKIPDLCRKSLDTDDIAGAIAACNFTKGTTKPGTVLPHGGVLVQGNNLEIKNGDTRLNKNPPFVIYTPETLTIKMENEDYIYLPSIVIEKLIIVESKLTREHVEMLGARYKWEEFVDGIDYELYIDLALIILQVILAPISIVGLFYSIKQRKIFQKLKARGLEKYKSRENLKNNQLYLMKRIQK